MIEEIRKLVKEACEDKKNEYGYGAWTYHISSVVKYAKLLARKLDADKEIVEIGALLHDYASVLNRDWYPEHHVHSARLAEEILKKHNYPEEKIEKVKHCIYAHRASKNIPRETTEAEIIASADGMAHFDNVSSLLQLAFVTHGKGIDEGTKYVLDKLERDWKKLMPEAKEIIKDKYEAIKLALKINEVDNNL